MITQAFMSFLHGLASLLFGWLHDHLPGAPSFWTDATDAVNTVFGMVPSSVRYFVPLSPAITAAVALMGLIVVLGMLRVARRVLSLFTGGGGNA